MQIPAWLATGRTSPLPAPRPCWGRADYLDRTLADIQNVMAEDLYQAGIAARPRFLQLLETRIKVAGMLALLVAVAVTKSIAALAVIHVVVFAAAVGSGISAGAYLARSWLPASLFTGIAVLPAALSCITPGDALLILYSGGGSLGPLVLPSELAVTRQGTAAAAMVLARAAASLGVVALVVKTSRWPVLTKAIQSLGVPGIFVQVLDLTYRYMFLFLLLLTDYLLGRRSRLVGRERQLAKLEWIGGTLAGFLRLVGEYSKEIAAAMIARGFDGGSGHTLIFRFGMREAVFLVGVTAVCAFLGGGHILVG